MATTSRNDLLSTRRILGGGAPGEGADSTRHETSATFEDGKAIIAALEHARGTGIERMASIGDGRMFEAVGASAAGSIPALLPIVPNIQGFMREAVEYGIVGAGIRRVRRMGPVPLVGLGIRGVTRLPQLYQRDFPTMLLCFIELELADFRRFNPEVTFLQAQVTDLALAMNNPRIIEAYRNAVARLTGAEPGYMTYNLATLAEKFAKWGIPAGPIVTPLEPTGGGMRPSLEVCSTAAKKLGADLWADRGGRPDAPSEAHRNFWGELGGNRKIGAWRDDDEALGIATGASDGKKELWTPASEVIAGGAS